ncbi:hypothetical protein [Saccharopolyspora phatthalungensis]|uniref:Uncharacterized protein n=1 Tax=Saccharopolyspora phatthalungensis TaxID=664693 RepID=A0A840Q1S9_9PSEU|nr:hypothetical protein [Saccharopolyspora phatthalungensis]MBB5156472.1 hypothetical protein [Saccharopolyspora phatthalungensis]
MSGIDNLSGWWCPGVGDRLRQGRASIPVQPHTSGVGCRTPGLEPGRLVHRGAMHQPAGRPGAEGRGNDTGPGLWALQGSVNVVRHQRMACELVAS